MKVNILSRMSSCDALGDAGDPAPVASPAAGDHLHSRRTSHPPPSLGPVTLLPSSVASDGVVASSGDGLALSQPGSGQGFLVKHVPWLLSLDPKSLLPPFSYLGDTFLQFILENFSSLVCSPVAPGSPLFAPLPVYVLVSQSDQRPAPLSSVCSLLWFWIGSAFKKLFVVEINHNVFWFFIASPKIASFLVSLGGLPHGSLVALFSALPSGPCPAYGGHFLAQPLGCPVSVEPRLLTNSGPASSLCSSGSKVDACPAPCGSGQPHATIRRRSPFVSSSPCQGSCPLRQGRCHGRRTHPVAFPLPPLPVAWYAPPTSTLHSAPFPFRLQ
jgi:hypothetical protein